MSDNVIGLCIFLVLLSGVGFLVSAPEDTPRPHRIAFFLLGVICAGALLAKILFALFL